MRIMAANCPIPYLSKTAAYRFSTMGPGSDPLALSHSSMRPLVMEMLPETARLPFGIDTLSYNSIARFAAVVPYPNILKLADPSYWIVSAFVSLGRVGAKSIPAAEVPVANMRSRWTAF